MSHGWPRSGTQCVDWDNRQERDGRIGEELQERIAVDHGIGTLKVVMINLD